MALVSQGPILFDTTIGQNIRFGIDDKVHQEAVTQEQIEEVCKAANIMTLLLGYLMDTIQESVIRVHRSRAVKSRE